jgi:plasmid stabilization system protein ParE
LEDLSKGKAFYDLQDIRVGNYFYDSLFSDIDSLLLFAGTHRKEFGYFRLLAQHFPYAVYYKIHDSEITVYRVLDCRQNPYSIKKSLLE